MSIIKWTPFLEPFEGMEKMLSDWPALRNGQSGFTPAIDVYENDNRSS